MDIVVDTNIVFSAVLGGRISRVFARAIIQFRLHTVKALIEEIQRHKTKIARYSTLTPETLETLIHHILTEDLKIHSTEKIPSDTKEKAKKLAKTADPSDWPFVALAIHLGAPLWTGDKQLIRLALRTGVFRAVDTHGVEMMLEGKPWSEVEEEMRKRYL